MRTLVWFRNDLRVDDNPALHEAMDRGDAVAVFCICNRQWRSHNVGDNRLAFLLDSLHDLADDLARLGVPLRLITEPWFDGLPNRLTKLARVVGATALAFNEEYPLNERVRDSRVRRAFERIGLAIHTHHGGVLLPPGSVLTGQGEPCGEPYGKPCGEPYGKPYTVFTPFKRRWMRTLNAAAPRALDKPRRQPSPDVQASTLPEQTDGVPRQRVSEQWPAGSREAHRRLTRFLNERVDDYPQRRNFPAVPGTSALSPYLSVGSISARQCLAAALDVNNGELHSGNPGITAWISELAWRDFYRHVVAHFPHVSRGEAFRRKMDHLPWRHAPDDLDAWKRGRTGFPLVDAAMRQLTTTGWMHNRLRMVTAMFLSKHLLLDWRLGEQHFMALLVDGDFAANNGGWQWSASTGTDAAPYFRIFNPHTQAKRFDPDGTFIRHFLPELADAPDAALFDPERHPLNGYPAPIVDHKAARQRALETFKAARGG